MDEFGLPHQRGKVFHNAVFRPDGLLEQLVDIDNAHNMIQIALIQGNAGIVGDLLVG